MLKVLFGLMMGVAGVIVSVYLGLPLNGPGPPNWRTAIGVLVLLAVPQWVSFYAFRHGIAVQVLLGLVVCAIATIGLLYSPRSFFWEARNPDGSSPITWHSTVAFLLLLAVTQGISFLIFRRVRSGGGRSSSAPHGHPSH